MAMLTLAAITSFVRDFVPGADADRIIRAANITLRQVYRKAGPTKWWTFTTTAPYSTGTLALTQGSTGVTLTGGTFASTTNGQIIRVEGEEAWFVFTRTAGTTGTLSSAWAAADAATATFELAYAFQDLPTDVLSLVKIRRPGREPLSLVADDDRREYGGRIDPAEPVYYTPIFADTSDGSVRYRLTPMPDVAYVYEACGRLRPTLYTSGGTEVSGLPDDYDDVIMAGTLYFTMGEEDAEGRAGFWIGQYKEWLRDAQAQELEGFEGRFREPGEARVVDPNRYPIEYNL